MEVKNMIEQAKWIKEFCDTEGFGFVDTDELGVKLPCALDRGYKKNDHTIFIQGFREGSKKIGISKGGLKSIMTLRLPIDKWDYEHIKKECIPSNFICAKCGKKNLNLRTQDNHKTYDCPECQVDAKSETQATKKVVA